MKFLTTDGWKDIELSPWAKYVAQDEDGTWTEWDRRPKKSGWQWFHRANAPWNAKVNELCIGLKPKDWTQELYEVY